MLDCLCVRELAPQFCICSKFHSYSSLVFLFLQLRWAGDPSVIIHVGASQVYTPIEVSEIRLSATLRVELIDIHPTLPCFRAVSLTFMHKPVLDFSLTVARLDVMNIGPGDYNVASMVRHLLHSVLSDAILYPKRVVIPMNSGSGSGSGDAAEPVGLVSVTFVKAVHLKRASMFGSDPYVVARIATTVQQKQGDTHEKQTNEIDEEQEQQKEQHQEQQKQQQMRQQVQEVRSSVKYSTQDPVWMETHDLIVFDLAKQQHIHFEVSIYCCCLLCRC